MNSTKNTSVSKLDADWVNNPERHRGYIPAIVLAGGLSRRMGGVDKTLMKLGGRPMISHALDCLDKQAGPLMINANGDANRFEELGYPVVAVSASAVGAVLACASTVTVTLTSAESNSPSFAR